MKTNVYLKIAAILVVGTAVLTGCNRELDFGQDVIIVTGTDSSPIVKFAVDGTEASYMLTASSTGRVKEDVKVTFAIEPERVAEYNKANKTKYYTIPASAVELEHNEVTIAAGSAVSNAVNVKFTVTEDIIEGPAYVIPVTIKSVSGGDLKVLETSRTIFLRVSQKINFNSLNINNNGFYSNYIFEDDKMVELTNFTCEIKFLVEDFNANRIRRLCNFTSKDEITNMLRLGESGKDKNQMQWVSPSGGLDSKTRFSPQTWYIISLTFDGSQYVMYVDGVKEAELSGDTPIEFQRIELGMSWTNYRSQQAFNGRIAEMRVWNRALGASEIQLGICAVDPASEGLVAYWKFNEGSGHIFTDYTGNGYDMDWSDTYREATDGAGLQPFDYSAQVRWIQADEKNICN